MFPLALVHFSLCLSPLTGRLPADASPRGRTLRASTSSFESYVASAHAVCGVLQHLHAEGSLDAANCRLKAADSAALSAILASSNGARGFFVNYLTDEAFTVADAEVPPPPLAGAPAG